MGESMGVAPMINRALHHLKTEVLVLVSGYIGGSDSNDILKKYAYVKCVRENPGIQRRVFLRSDPRASEGPVSNDRALR